MEHSEDTSRRSPWNTRGGEGGGARGKILRADGRYGTDIRGRCAHVACWASWTDALQRIIERTPTVANVVVRTIDGGPSNTTCLAQLWEAADRLDMEGF